MDRYLQSGIFDSETVCILSGRLLHVTGSGGGDSGEARDAHHRDGRARRTGPALSTGRRSGAPCTIKLGSLETEKHGSVTTCDRYITIAQRCVRFTFRSGPDSRAWCRGESGPLCQQLRFVSVPTLNSQRLIQSLGVTQGDTLREASNGHLNDDRNSAFGSSCRCAFTGRRRAKRDVRCWRLCGKHILVLRIAGFDSERTTRGPRPGSSILKYGVAPP
jgi:hypothetical protein